GNVFALVSFSVARRHANFQICGALDDVLVRHDITRGINNEAASEALHRLPQLSLRGDLATEKLIEQFVVRILHSALDDTLGIDVYDRRPNFPDRDDRRLGSRIALRKNARAE